ncbi:MAG TPA: DUF2808 domain-containing protein [Trichocoleus sp.]
MKLLLHLPSGRTPLLASALALLSLLPGASALAGRLDNGRVVFDSPLDLVEVAPVDANALEVPANPSRQANYPPNQHQVVIHVPPEAGEPLEAVVITPRLSSTGTPAMAPTITFDTNATAAFVSHPSTNPQPEPLELVSVGGPSPDLNQALVVLAQPVQPGDTLTVVLTLEDAADVGLHEVEITAYPAGADSVGQFLGRSQLSPEPRD